ncbi:MAG: DUF5655 domain-containing protein [bacterium]
MKEYSKYLVNKSPEVSVLLDKLFLILDEITKKDYVVERKVTSLHIVKGKAFLGIHFLKDTLRINIVLEHAISMPNLYKSELISKNRFHNRVDLSDPKDLNKEVIGYIKEAYNLK